MLPSIVIANLTTDPGKEILVPQPPSASGEDAQLWLFDSDGNDATGWSGSYDLDGGGDMDATPVVGDIDEMGKLKLLRSLGQIVQQHQKSLMFGHYQETLQLIGIQHMTLQIQV